MIHFPFDLDKLTPALPNKWQKWLIILGSLSISIGYQRHNSLPFSISNLTETEAQKFRRRRIRIRTQLSEWLAGLLGVLNPHSATYNTRSGVRVGSRFSVQKLLAANVYRKFNYKRYNRPRLMQLQNILPGTLACQLLVSLNVNYGLHCIV